MSVSTRFVNLYFDIFMAGKFGQPYRKDPVGGDWRPAAFGVLGLGKLGGRELNYSSDIDIMFAYSGEGSCSGSLPPKLPGQGADLPIINFSPG